MGGFSVATAKMAERFRSLVRIVYYCTMARNLEMENRVRIALEDAGTDWEEKQMFRGTSFLVKGKLTVGAGDNELLVHLNPSAFEQALSMPHTRRMQRGGKPVKGWLFVHEDGFRTDEELAQWVRWSLQA